MITRFWRFHAHLTSILFTGLLLSMLGLLHGCGGGGGGGVDATAANAAEDEANTGKVIIGLTDAEGDFLSYAVDVTALQLRKANGTVVETLPLSTRVDFAELTEVTEFLTVATVPVGVYESVSIELDFTNAEIIVMDEEGGAIAARAVDEDGNPLGEFAVRLQLTTADAVRIAPGIPAAFSLDFDLDASNDIDLQSAPPIVEVMPFLLATPEFEADRLHRVRGGLESVDVGASTITLVVRPFRHRVGRFGEFTLDVDEATLYEIDGVAFSGEEGLAEMASLSQSTPVIALGMVVDGAFLATEVLAGSSVPWTTHDVARGVVTARSGDELTLRGVKVDYADNSGLDVYRGEVIVSIGPETVVTALGVATDLLSAQSISVGQRVVAFGEMRSDGETRYLDASSGRVRMQMNQLTAEVVQPTPLVVDVYHLNGRRPGAYDFSGTGVSPDDDADPDHYEIDTGTLPLSSVEDGDLVRVRGLVNDFGAAPADYNARTLIDLNTDMRGAHFVASWPEATNRPFSAIEPSRLDVDLAAARSLLKVRGIPVDLTNPLEALALIAADGGRGVFAVRVRGAGEIHLYRHFADLVDEVVEQLDAGRELKRMAAHGRYNGNQELTTGRASFDFLAPSDAQE